MHSDEPILGVVNNPILFGPFTQHASVPSNPVPPPPPDNFWIDNLSNHIVHSGGGRIFFNVLIFQDQNGDVLADDNGDILVFNA